MTHPDADDVVVRQRRSNPDFVYVLGTPRTPEQFLVHNYDDGVRRAIAFAGRRHVRAWFDEGDDTYRLLGTFRDQDVTPRKTVARSTRRKVKARVALPGIAVEAAGGLV